MCLLACRLQRFTAPRNLSGGLGVNLTASSHISRSSWAAGPPAPGEQLCQHPNNITGLGQTYPSRQVQVQRGDHHWVE